MTAFDAVEDSLNQLASISPAGFAIGLHLEFTTSKYIFQHYSRSWMEEYSRRGLILIDPTVRWGIENEGWIRWSELAAIDSGGVLTAAAEFGLKYGVSIAAVGRSSRSLGSFASPEREFTESEIAELSVILRHLHDSTADVEPESSEDLKLKRLASSLAHS
jgi:LuxR family transcriptional regulator, quorum-sensing system regulator SdiA